MFRVRYFCHRPYTEPDTNHRTYGKARERAEERTRDIYPNLIAEIIDCKRKDRVTGEFYWGGWPLTVDHPGVVDPRRNIPTNEKD